VVIINLATCFFHIFIIDNLKKMNLHLASPFLMVCLNSKEFSLYNSDAYFAVINCSVNFLHVLFIKMSTAFTYFVYSLIVLLRTFFLVILR